MDKSPEVVKHWGSLKQTKCPWTDEQIKKMWYINTMEYYSTIKRKKFCHLQQHVDIEGIIISEVSQTEKDKYL